MGDNQDGSHARWKKRLPVKSRPISFATNPLPPLRHLYCYHSSHCQHHIALFSYHLSPHIIIGVTIYAVRCPGDSFPIPLIALFECHSRLSRSHPPINVVCHQFCLFIPFLYQIRLSLILSHWTSQQPSTIPYTFPSSLKLIYCHFFLLARNQNLGASCPCKLSFFHKNNHIILQI